MDAQTKKQQRRETYQFRVNTLLTLIGLWLALPTTCGVLQRMADTLTSLTMISAYTNAVVIAKFIIDVGLLCFYGFGIALLIFIGVTGWIAHKASDGINTGVDSFRTAAMKTTETIGGVITDGTDILKTTYTETKPKVQAAIQEKIPEIQGSLRTFYGGSKTKMGSMYVKFRERFPKIGHFLDKFFEPYSTE